MHNSLKFQENSTILSAESMVKAKTVESKVIAKCTDSMIAFENSGQNQYV